MIPLLEEARLCEVVPFGPLSSEYDFHCPLVSLANIFGTTLESVPNQVPYLRAKSELVVTWRQRLADVAGLRVGICWQGNPEFPGDRARSIPLAAFAPLAEIRGVRLISLQKVAGLDQLAAVRGQFEVRELGPEYDEESGAFMNAAAVIENLDLVIAADTAIAHLAGALGAPVWIALPKVPDWRWLLTGDTSPWYPTMRLFRQSRAGDWDGLFGRIVEALSAEAAGGRTRAPR